MEDTRKNLFLGIGTTIAALSASLCCILPIAVAVLGAGSAAFAAQMEPLRPWFLGFTVLFLGFGFYRAYRPEACAPGESCAAPVNRRRTRTILWTVTALAVTLTAFPTTPRSSPKPSPPKRSRRPPPPSSTSKA